MKGMRNGDVARLIGVRPTTVSRWVTAGKVKTTERVRANGTIKRRILFPKDLYEAHVHKYPSAVVKYFERQYREIK